MAILARLIQEAKERIEGTENTACRFPHEFKPNPGGQAQLFEHLSLDPDIPDPTPYRWIFLRGGINSGKSFAGAAFICASALRDRDSRLLITAGSYGQLRTSTLVAFAEFCKLYRIPLDPTAGVPLDSPEWADLTAQAIANRRFCTVFGAPVLVLSVEAFTGRTESSKETGRGAQVRRAWCDEFTYADKSAFATIDGRLGRGVGSLKGLGLITSSINKNSPYNWAYDLFDAPDRPPEQVNRFLSIKATTRENIYLDADYYESQAAALGTPESIQIELEGEYAAANTDRVAEYFNRKVHALHGEDVAIAQFQPEYGVHISLDFNRSPSCAGIAQWRDEELFVIQEFYILNCGTRRLSEAIAVYLKNLPSAPISIAVHGDASGNQRKSNRDRTDWEIFWECLREAGFNGNARYGRANPPVKSRINALNTAFFKDRVFINGETCKELIKDLESVQWKEGRDEIDKSDLMRTHPLDWLSYMVNDLMPINSRQYGEARAIW